MFFLWYFLRFTLFLVGIYFLASSIWELRKGTDKKRFLTSVVAGAGLLAVSYSFLQILRLFPY
ncbi:hypothetical protein SAMN04487936_103363 [Halobacillus dabanensis]|uniref:Uncharacterized protein n=1 Tax=Halobacillus dabanensis TaxID=240302 RepID=A0A1I3TJ98_HALDA|nr:hypothetical protein SAMN04487936_103363 [Halobacillus dabanensis]